MYRYVRTSCVSNWARIEPPITEHKASSYGVNMELEESNKGRLSRRVGILQANVSVNNVIITYKYSFHWV